MISQITSNSISTGAVTANSIANYSITGIQLANNTITGAQITNSTITATQIAPATITGGLIVPGTLTPSLHSAGVPVWDSFGNLVVGGNISVAGSMTVAGTTTIENVNISNTTIVTSELIMAPAVNTQVINAGTSNTLTFISNNITGMTLTTGGYLGIGTTTPNTYFQIGNNTTAIPNANTIGALSINKPIDSASNNNGTRLIDLYGYYTNYLNTNPSASIGAGSWTGNTQDGYLTFLTLNSGTLAEVGRFDWVGNLGVGVTPSSWASGNNIEIGTNKNIASQGGYLQMLGNAYLNGGYYYKSAGYSTAFVQNNSGQFQWYVAGSGSAGGTISYSQAMTLTNAGQLLLGTTTAQERLTVNGNINLSGSIYQSSGSFTCPHGGPAVTFTINGLRDLQRYLVGAYYGDYGNCLGGGMWLVECLNGSSIAAVTTLNTVNYNGSLGYVNGQTYGGAGAGSYSAGNGDQMQLVFYQNGTGVSTAQPCYYFVLQLA